MKDSFEASGSSVHRERPIPWLALALGCQIVVSLLALKSEQLRYLHCYDEYCRLWFSMEWARSPFLATKSHIWLGGNFWILGSLIRLFHDPVWAGVVHGLVQGLLLVPAAWLFARSLGASPAMSAAACVLLSFRPVVAALSVSGLPDLLFTDCLLFAAAAMGNQLRRTGLLRLRPSLWIVGGCLAVMLSETLRYEGWFLAVGWGITLLVMFVQTLWAKQWRWACLWGCLGLSIAVFPLIWMADAHRVLGLWTSFMSSYTLHGSTAQLRLDQPFGRIAFYPLYTSWQMPVLLPFAFWGIWTILRRRSMMRNASLLVFLVFAAVLLTMTAWRGTGICWVFRYATSLVVPLVILAVFGIDEIARLFRRTSRGFAIGFVVVVIGLDLAVAAWTARSIVTPRSVADKSIIAVARILRDLPATGKSPMTIALREPYEEHYWDFEKWVLAVHAGMSYRVDSRTSNQTWLSALKSASAAYYVTSAGPIIQDPRYLAIPTQTDHVRLYAPHR